MPQRRYLLVEGVAGVAVSDPRAPARHGQPARYIGHELSGTCQAAEDGTCKTHKDPDHVLDHYRVAQLVIEDHRDIRGAIATGSLKLLSETTAKSYEEARAALIKTPAAKPTKETA